MSSRRTPSRVGPSRRPVRRVAGEAGGGRGETVEALVDRLRTALDQAVGVQQQAGAGRERGGAGAGDGSKASSGGAAPARRNRTAPSGSISSGGRWPALAWRSAPVSGSSRTSRAVAIRPARSARRSRRRSIVVRLSAVEHAGAQAAAQLAHQRRGRDALAGDVADRERDLAAVEAHGVVPVAPDLAGGGLEVGAQAQAGDLGQALRQQRALERLGDPALALEQCAREIASAARSAAGVSRRRSASVNDDPRGRGPGGRRARCRRA